MVFFVSWQLWEQLTFVLASCLGGVFVIGYVKLWWINRKVRKHELVDEEKRLRIEEMRQLGQLQETKENLPIPFGIRAIENGIEVDGIWISRDSTPIPEEKRIGKYVKRKSDASDFSVSNRSKSSISSVSQIPSINKGGRRTLSSTFGFSNVNTEYAPAWDISGDEGPGTPARRTYKPVRSSQLRYSSYNDVEYDPDTLGKLEGSIPIQDGVQVHRPRGAGPMPETAINTSSASLADNADNERSSGSSTSSIGTFAHNGHIDPTPASESYVAVPFPSRQVQHHGQYNPMHIPRTPAASIPNPFDTPDRTPEASDASLNSMQTPETYHTAAEISRDSDVPLLQSRGPSESPERPDIALQGTRTKHVNSGFSVLPAGTFATEQKEKEVEQPTNRDSQSSETSQKKKRNKLQKKARFSMTGPRRSTDLR